MKSLQQVHVHIASLNQPAGDLFGQVSDALGPRLSASELLEWAYLCDTIAASGWHGWETAREYIAISRALFGVKGVEYLLARGRYGLSLCEYSFEPGFNYFSGLKGMVNGKRLAGLERIEEACETVHSRFKQASNLLSNSLLTGFEIATEQDIGQLTAWCNIVRKYVNHGRQSLEAFLEAGLGQKHFPWEMLHDMSRVSLAGVTQVMNHLPQFQEIPGPYLDSLFVKYAGDGIALTAWLDTLPAVLADSPEPVQQQLVNLMASIPDADLASRFLKQIPALPLAKASVVADWIGRGVETSLKNRTAGEAYFDLESASARRYLQQLEGRVNYMDCQRLFQLFGEALSGIKLRIEVLPKDLLSKEQADDYRDTPFTDGSSIYLPESEASFNTWEENFFAYKMMLLHQLGFYEFGTFDLSKSSRAFFSGFSRPELAKQIFNILEDGRIDWLLHRKYKGIRTSLDQLMEKTLEVRDASVKPSPVDQLLEGMIRFSLNGNAYEVVEESYHGDLGILLDHAGRLKHSTSVRNTLDATACCYDVLDTYLQGNESLDPTFSYHPVFFRGRIDIQALSLYMQLAHLEESVKELLDDEQTLSLTSLVDPANVKLEQLKKGEVQDAMGMFLTDLESMVAEEEVDEDRLNDGKGELEELLQLRENRKLDGDLFYYDEWDCLIDDYRSNWCMLYEQRELEEREVFVSETLKEHGSLALQVRRQLQMLKPGMLRKVKAMPEGEDLDLEKVIESVVDKKSGRSPDDNLYIQRTRKERDVSALFLLDMSASTDDIISTSNEAGDGGSDSPEAQAGSGGVDDAADILESYYSARSARVNKDGQPGKRIIDIEKQAAVLMAEALEDLGDNYSICGFSGYGRERIDYYVCKDFDEKYNYRVKGKIGGIKPCRSTRMGPAIRHAVRNLTATESRIKALIIISDGYPQDYDYGHDRNNRDYGVQDTTKALSEARQKGVQTFCLTVDPSGHDYLREMCPDQQYMVIQDIDQLPHELSKVYRSLTG